MKKMVIYDPAMCCSTGVCPITMVDDEVVKTREYPTNDEFVEFLDIPKEYIMSGIAIQKMKKNKGNK